MLTTRVLRWLGHCVRLVVRDTAYVTLVAGALLAIPLVVQGSEHSKPLMALMRVDDPMVAYLADVGGHAILLGNLVSQVAVADLATRLLLIPLVVNLAQLWRRRDNI